jgi:hypothetical protein
LHKVAGKKEKRGEASDNVMKKRQEILLFSVAIHTFNDSQTVSS